MVVRPSFHTERDLFAQGFRAIVGVDEAGCGALAGPLVAAAVIFPLDSRLGGVRDSKLLNPDQRNELYDQIVERSEAWAVGSASVEEITTLGLRPANLLAMKRAIDGIPSADFALVDAWTIPGLTIPQRGIIRGDRLIKSIAAASVIAKVTRDRIMLELARRFPQYGFDIHKGYATKLHQTAIQEHGPCEMHRLTFKTFAPVLKNGA
jgi:ribonuclease HII